MGNRVLFVEFNELCPPLLERFMAQGSLPNFKSFYRSSQVFTTVADAEPPALEPWVQWYSMHTGLAYAQHQVFNLTDGAHADFPDVWSVLGDAGRSVFNCSSMNSKSKGGAVGLFLPDPWSDTIEAFPAELNRFYRFVKRYVQEYTNPAERLGVRAHLDFAHFAVTHGLSKRTIAAVLRQLARERASRKASWRRAPLLDLMQFDVFRHYYSKESPEFATFFTNSTAHYQHAYWRYMEPELFSDVAADGQSQYGDAVLYGYTMMDALLGDIVKLAEEKGAQVVLATALSQQPFTKAEGQGGHRFYRPHDVESFLRLLGVDFVEVQPVMTHEYVVRFSGEASSKDAYERIKRIRTDTDEVVFAVEKAQGHDFRFSCCVYRPVKQEDLLVLGDGREVPFFDAFYEIDEIKSGCHHPDGVLWFRTGEHRVHEEKVSVLDVFPTLLAHYGVALPQGYDYQGKNLIERFGSSAPMRERQVA